ncbi:MAG TPA: hypothetical protein VMW75_02010 [Thermoanaerobaculia bacterium]|nr:hypothetical protein [Thermoanaerobaculia bacterium]
MIDLAALTDGDFAPHFGSRYRLQLAGAPEPLDLELVEITPGGQAPRRNRRTFSLVFRGPRRPWLPQGVYRLDHEAMGALELFLVPIGPDPQGPLYQAVFT